MDIQEKIQAQLEHILKGMGVTDVIPVVERPRDLSHADFSSNCALILAKQLGKTPMVVAEDIAKQFMDNLPEAVLSVQAVAPGYINFTFSMQQLVSQVKEVLMGDQAKVSQNSLKKVIVEYSSPNIAKPFTIGHLRSTIIGDAVANLLEVTGHQVFRDNHIGDWGTQFGKQIYAIKAWGDEANISSSDRPVKLLVELYVKFHEEAEKDPSLEDKAREWFKKLEDGDSEARALWQKCIDWSWKEFESIYQQLGIPSSGASFENNGRGYGEAYFEDKMSPVIKELEEKGLLLEGKEGAKIVEFPEQTKYPPLMILKKDGASLYATRDLATDHFRLEKYGKDIVIINEVGAEQALYWQQIFTLEQMLGWYKPEQRVHIKHGMYRFKEGKMSTRKGNVIWLEDVLEEALQRALQLTTENQEQGTNEEIAKIIAIGAIKWNDLKRDAKQDINFDWDDVLSMQGNSGPYMQYVAVRCQSVLSKAGINKNDLLKWDFDIDALLSEELNLLRRLVGYQQSVEEAASKYAPHVLATYLFELAQDFNLFYQKVPILKAEDTEKHFRLFLTAATEEIVTRGLKLLGISVPERM